MAHHPNASLAQRNWQAVSRSDTETLRSLWHPDIVWHATARGTPWSGDHKGADAILDFLARIGESLDRFDADLEDLLVSDGRFSLILRIRAGRGDRDLEVSYQLTARVEDRLVVEVWTMPLEPTALSSFWN